MLALLACAAAFGARAQEGNFAALDAALSALEREQMVMGSLAVSVAGTPRYTRAIGLAQDEPGVRATPQTPYAIGSVSKLFTAALVMQLADEEKLSLETPLARFFPELPNAQAITVRQLLQHRSGLPEIQDLPDFHQRWARQPRSRQQIVAAIASLPPRDRPGARTEYNNSGPILLSLIVEQLTGSPYGQAIERRIARPLGLRQTSYREQGPAPTQSFRWDDGAARWARADSTHFSVPLGSGGVVSTPGDMVRFIRALYRSELTKPQSTRAMFSLLEGFGLGVMAIPGADGPGRGHEGVIDGYTALLVYLPERDMAIAWTANGQRLPRERVTEVLWRTLLEPGYRAPRWTAAPQPLRFVVEPGPGRRALAEAQGLTLRGDTAPLDWQRGVPMQRQADGRWTVEITPFLRDGVPLQYKYVIGADAWERTPNRLLERPDPPSSEVLLREDRLGVDPARQALHAEIARADEQFFAAYARRDADTMERFFSPRLEFFHDLGGLADRERTLRAFRENFARGLERWRVLEQASMEVFPMGAAGAMQFGTHHFCRREDGQERCEPARFAHVWELTAQGWQLLRVLSYDH